MRAVLMCLLGIFLSSPSFASDRFLDIQDITTPSGISVWLVEDHSVPVISLKFAFKDAGAFNEVAEKQGLVQLLSNTMDEGAGDFDSQAFQKALSDHSISLSFSGGRDSFSGSIKTLTDNKDTAFNLLHLALTQPRFDAEPLERMKQANLSRIKQSMTRPNWIAARLMNDIAFNGHPYAQNSGGTLSTIPNITANDLRTFIKQELTRDRLRISIAGDITAEQVKLDIDKIFKTIPTVKREDVSAPHTITGQGSITLFQRDIPQTIVNITLPGIRKTDPDYYTAKVMNHIYGAGGFGSRLMDTIREKEGLTYGIYSGLSEMNWTETLSISTSTNNETTGKVINLIKQEATILKEQSITPEELQKAKDYILGSMPLSLTSTGALASIMLSLQIHDLPHTYLDTINKQVEAVTIEDIQRVAKQLLNFKKSVTVLVGQPEKIVPSKTVSTLPNVE